MFAISPALGQAFDDRSFSDVTIPVELLAGDADRTVPLATNVRHVATLLPSARLTLISGAGHYTFLAACAPAMISYMPLLCTDNPGIDRTAVHAVAIERAKAFFASTLPAGQR